MNKIKRKTVEYGKYGYYFIIPFFLVFIVFQLYPLLYTFYTSLLQVQKVGRNSSEVVFCLGNFTDYVFKQGNEFWPAAGVTVVLWILNFVPQVALSLLLAAWFTDAHNKLKGQGAYKVIMYMPNIITAATIAVLFFSLFDVHGSITGILRNMGVVVGEDSILTHGPASFFVIAFIQFWMWYGNTMIILIAGISSISTSLFESAQIDGASNGQIFRRITIPLIRPIMLYTLITALIGGLQMYDIPKLLQNGEPTIMFLGTKLKSTETILMYIQDQAFGIKSNHFIGVAAAVSVLLFAITSLISAVLFYVMRDKDASRAKKLAKKGGIVR